MHLNLHQFYGFVLIPFSIFSCSVASESGVQVFIQKLFCGLVALRLGTICAALAVSRSVRASCHSCDAPRSRESTSPPGQVEVDETG